MQKPPVQVTMKKSVFQMSGENALPDGEMTFFFFIQQMEVSI